MRERVSGTTTKQPAVDFANTHLPSKNNVLQDLQSSRVEE